MTPETAELIIRAVERIWHQLPEKLGDDWEAFREELFSTLQAAGEDISEEEVATKIQAVFRKYKQADRLLKRTIRILEGGSSARTTRATNDPYFRIPVYFATNRQHDSSRELADQFIGRAEEDGTLHLGQAVVSIPHKRETGELNSPSRWRFEEADPAKHIMVLTLDLLDADGFKVSVQNDLQTADKSEIMVFIHGYNVSFRSALRRTAQVAYDIGFGGVPMLYSWPSAARTLWYLKDAKTIAETQPIFNNFVTMLREEMGATKIHIVGHSMGNRLLTRGMSTIDVTSEGSPLEQIVFAAPDVAATEFQELSAAYPGKAVRYTLYANKYDWPIELSQYVNREGPRAGDVDGDDNLVVVDGVETINVTAADSSLDGHSYIGSNASIIGDLSALILNNADPGRRSWLQLTQQADGRPFWTFMANE